MWISTPRCIPQYPVTSMMGCRSQCLDRRSVVRWFSGHLQSNNSREVFSKWLHTVKDQTFKAWYSTSVYFWNLLKLNAHCCWLTHIYPPDIVLIERWSFQAMSISAEWLVMSSFLMVEWSGVWSKQYFATDFFLLVASQFCASYI